MADEAELMTKLKDLIESPENRNGSVEKYIQICFNREYGIREPVTESDLQTQIKLRQFMDQDEHTKELVEEFIKYMFYRRGLGRKEEMLPDIID